MTDFYYTHRGAGKYFRHLANCPWTYGGIMTPRHRIHSYMRACAAGKILGWFQGQMEFGPRALGSRSIPADPREPEMNAKVHNTVKFREWWRPFAPSLKKEAADEYPESATDAPFMILTAQVRPEKRSVIPAVTHVDGSARPQTVEKEINPIYWRLIDEFGKRTCVPVVVNTSFNLRGEAIVHTPIDAIRTFFSSGMDALAIGSFLVEK
ncbi:MAG TPA: carbamoyltransferase C-terminal domain-containing protein [Candidatus Acidoferrum sp.]